ncbi:hypothetical protein EV421DRAFT_1909422 [Armillaria borealis]|uniref:Uncharacterized protein n=1 Tax=Armillaria borealis TaxID=47425 RepID=A0AA39MHV5_9AGAR|nr:hypothetical protein EV421DRAFT_1909422 [Armillaria borealis]
MTTNPTFSMSTTFGAVLIGATLASALFGVTTMLFFVYYRRYSQDRRFYRFSLALLWVLDALHFVLALHILHFYLVDSFGDVMALSKLVWSFKLDFSTHLAIVVGVNLVCVVRLCMLGRYFHRIVPWILSLAVAGAVSVVIRRVLIYDVYTISNFSQFSDISMIMDGALVVGAVVDLTICLSMSYYLFKSRAVTISPRTSGRLLVLMRLVLMSGMAETLGSDARSVSHPSGHFDFRGNCFSHTKAIHNLSFDNVTPNFFLGALLALAFTRLNARSPQPSKRSHGKVHLQMEANEAHFIPLNFLDVTVTDEQSTVENLHDQPGISSTA